MVFNIDDIYTDRQGNKYKCTTAGTTPSGVPFDPNNIVSNEIMWGTVGFEKQESGGGGTNISDWATSTSYSVGDYVRNNNILYVCNTAHTSTTFASDIANWTAITTEEMRGATSLADGDKGAVPKPLIGDENKFLRGDGTWQTPTAVYANRNVLFSGQVAQIGTYTLSDVYTNYDYILIYLSYTDAIGSANYTEYNEGIFLLDTSTENIIDVHTNDSGSYTASSWSKADYVKTIRGASLKFYGTTMEIFDQNNLSVPTTTVGGYFISKVIGLKFVNGGSGGVQLDAWQPNTLYSVGDTLVYNGTIYLVNTGFTSGSTFNDTNLSAIVAKPMVGATSSANGESGIVPQPTTSDISKFLCGDGTWKSAGGSGLNVGRTLLWEGNIMTSIPSSSQETLLNSCTDYDYLEFIAGWADSQTVPPDAYSGYPSEFSAVLGSSFEAGLSFDVNIGTNETNHFHLFCNVHLNDNKFYCDVFKYRGTNTATSNSGLCLWKIYGIKLYNPNNYSTEEQEIGTWIDGKKLYQKTFSVSVPSTSAETAIATLAADSLIECTGYFVYNNDYMYIPYWYSTGDYSYLYYRKSNNTIYLKVISTSYANSPCYITVKYTKT